jgi:transcriptional regulator GlxA family with amidase domain
MAPIHVSLVIVPETAASTLMGLYDVLNMPRDIAPDGAPFELEIVAEHAKPLMTSSGIAIQPHKTVDDIGRTDIVLVPSLLLDQAHWHKGRYPKTVDWLLRMYQQGATLCSACSGVLLIAETGLLDGKEATIHWAYARTFRANFPKVKLRLEKVLVTSGAEQHFVMSGASASWHDLALYLVARYVGPSAAQALSKFYLLQWHADGQLPYVIFHEEIKHDDELIYKAQQWMKEHLESANPVEEVMRQSQLPDRTFKRRFKKATGHTPIAYIQHLRVEAAKQQLESGETPIDEISYSVGYDNAAFFRRLFKRITGLPPGEYRRKFSFKHLLENI